MNSVNHFVVLRLVISVFLAMVECVLVDRIRRCVCGTKKRARGLGHLLGMMGQSIRVM